MLSTDQDALICDFAEYYHILNFDELPIKLKATLAVGLGNNSRIIRKLRGETFSLTEMTMFAILDRLSVLIWQNSEDGTKGKNFPKSILSVLNGEPEKEQIGFASGEEFEKERERILNTWQKEQH